jgi:hypothetical protein
MFYGLRQLAAPLSPINGLRRRDDESGSKLPQSIVDDFPLSESFLVLDAWG